jgi:tetratricopeptide (TPR) repeat protein
VISLVALAVAGPSLYVLRKWQLARTATAYLRRAEELEKEEKWREAAEQIGRFLALRPQDAQAKARLADAVYQVADTPRRKSNAAALYYDALGHDLGDRQWSLRHKLAKLLLELERYPDAEEQARKILEHDPSQAEAQRILGMALFGRVQTGSLRDFTQEELKRLAAIRTLTQARQANPRDAELASALAIVYRSQPEMVRAEQPQWTQKQREEAADRCLDDLIAADPNSPRAYLARFAYRRQLGHSDAEADLKRALELGPDDDLVLSAAGAYELSLASGASTDSDAERRMHAHQAAEHFRRLTTGKTKAANAAHCLLLGRALYLEGKPDEAIAVWKEGQTKFGDEEVTFLGVLADSYLELNRLAEAQETLAAIDQRIAALTPRLSSKGLAALSAPQELRRATLAFRQKDYASALSLLQRVASRSAADTLNRDAAVEALVMLGQVYLSQGLWREAATSFDEACNRQPALPQVRLAASQAWLDAGRASLAVERAEQSLSLRDSTEGWLSLSAALLREQSSRPASARDWTRFEFALAETERRNEVSPLAAPWLIPLLRVDYLLALADAQAGAPSEGTSPESILRDLEAKYAAEIGLWGRLALVWQRLNLPAEADRAVNHLESLPDGALPALRARIRLCRIRKEFDRADQLLASALAQAPPALQRDLVREWVNLKVARGDADAARKLLLEQRKRQPDDASVLRFLAELDLQAGRSAEAENWENQLAALPHPAPLHARLLRAQRLLQAAPYPGHASFRAAQTEVRVLQEQAPQWHEVQSLAGLIAQRRGDFSTAATHYAQAISLGEQRLAVFEQLITMLERLGRLDDAQEYLQRLQSIIPQHQSLTVLQGAVELRLDQPERALETARRAVAQRPNDVPARLWLANMLLLDQEFGEAEAELKGTLADHPQDMRVWSSLLLFYVRAGQTSQLIETAAQVQSNVELPSQERHFIAAQALEMAGQRDLAARSYEEAAKAAPKSAAVQFRIAQFYLLSDAARAESHLEEALRNDPRHRGARRTLAALLAAKGGEADWQRSLSLLSDQGLEDADTAMDQRLQAALLMQRGGKEHLDRATRIAEGLVLRAPQALPGDRMLLAQLYERQALAHEKPAESAKHLELARREFTAAASHPQAEGRHFAALIEFLLRSRNKTEASQWLARHEEWLRTHSRADAEAIALWLRLALQLQQWEKCAPWLDRLEAEDSDPLRALALRVRWYKGQNDRDKIRKLLMRRGNELLAKQTSDAGKVQVAAAIGGLYRAADFLPEAEQWQRRVLALDPTRYEALAQTLTKQGNWSQAVELCRQAADKDKSARPALVLVACLSSVQATSDRTADCESLVQQALEQNPKNLDLRYCLGVLRVMQGRVPEAAQTFRSVLAANPRHVASLNNLALLLAEEEATRDEAIQLIDRAIDLAGLIPDLCDTKGTILIAAGRPQDAVPYLQAATKGESVDPRFYFHLAIALHALGNDEQARTFLERALDDKLEEQVLTPSDQRQLATLRQRLTSQPVSEPST